MISRLQMGIVCSLLLCFTSLLSRGEALSIAEVFHAPVWSSDRWIAGSLGYFTLDNKAALFDSGRNDSAYYRCTSLAPIDAMGGDFEVEFAFAIQRLDHWNGLSLRVSALDGSWSSQLTRQQRGAGQHELLAVVDQRRRNAVSNPRWTIAGERLQ